MKNAVLKVIESIEGKIRREACDNEKFPNYRNSDGILMCGKCNTPMETYVEIDKLNVLYERFKNHKFPILCKCRKEQTESDERRLRQNETELLIRRLKQEGFTDKNYLKYTFSHDDNKNSKISKACKKYADDFEFMYKSNKGIVFFGPVGTGKTFYSCCIANEVLSKGRSVLVSNFPNLITKLNTTPEEKSYVLNKISNVSLLTVDDFGTERDTSYSLEKIFEIIDTRYRSGKPLIVTTNLKLRELKNPSDIRYQRVYNRILQMCYPIAVVGENRRDRIIEKSEEFMSDFLGLK